jgi:hypothetical protein
MRSEQPRLPDDCGQSKSLHPAILRTTHRQAIWIHRTACLMQRCRRDCLARRPVDPNLRGPTSPPCRSLATQQDSDVVVAVRCLFCTTHSTDRCCRCSSARSRDSNAGLLPSCCTADAWSSRFPSIAESMGLRWPSPFQQSRPSTGNCQSACHSCMWWAASTRLRPGSTTMFVPMLQTSTAAAMPPVIVGAISYRLPSAGSSVAWRVVHAIALHCFVNALPIAARLSRHCRDVAAVLGDQRLPIQPRALAHVLGVVRGFTCGHAK